ncbi:hypothetical protein BT69DRAFT_1320051, partial [Atractiella rhizophila]
SVDSRLEQAQKVQQLLSALGGAAAPAPQPFSQPPSTATPFSFPGFGNAPPAASTNPLAASLAAYQQPAPVANHAPPAPAGLPGGIPPAILALLQQQQPQSATQQPAPAPAPAAPFNLGALHALARPQPPPAPAPALNQNNAQVQALLSLLASNQQQTQR